LPVRAVPKASSMVLGMGNSLFGGFYRNVINTGLI